MTSPVPVPVAHIEKAAPGSLSPKIRTEAAPTTNPIKGMIMSTFSLSHLSSRTPAPSACASWCTVALNGDSHDDDEYCFNEGVKIPLSLEEPDEYGDENDTAVFIECQPGSTPQVCIEKNDEPTLNMTLDEARQLLAGIQNAIALASAA